MTVKYTYERASRCLLHLLEPLYAYVSGSDTLVPNDYFSDTENVLSFERAMFEDYSFKYR